MSDLIFTLQYIEQQENVIQYFCSTTWKSELFFCNPRIFSSTNKCQDMKNYNSVVWEANLMNIGTNTQAKNDDSVKEAPAYCWSFLDGLHTWKGGEGQRKSLSYSFLMFSNVLWGFVKFCNFWRTDRPTDRPTNLDIRAPSQSLKRQKKYFCHTDWTWILSPSHALMKARVGKKSDLTNPPIHLPDWWIFAKLSFYLNFKLVGNWAGLNQGVGKIWIV